MLERIENNNGLNELLKREIEYKDKMLKEYDDTLTDIEMAKKEKRPIPELTPWMI
jgi:hypothetical protein